MMCTAMFFVRRGYVFVPVWVCACVDMYLCGSETLSMWLMYGRSHTHIHTHTN